MKNNDITGAITLEMFISLMHVTLLFLYYISILSLHHFLGFLKDYLKNTNLHKKITKEIQL